MPTPTLLFPCHSLDAGEPDAGFEDEVRHARDAGFSVGFVGLEMHFGGDVSFRRVPPGPVLYRGWIVKPEDYARMSDALAARGASLVVSPEAYLFAYHFPNWYAAIELLTPPSVWIPKPEGAALDLDAIAALAAERFGDAPILVKDYVKSRKHEWFDACFMPSAADTEGARRVVGNFVERQAEMLVGGVVLRAFVPLARIGIHTKSRLPLVNEHRFFVLHDEVVDQAPYWGEGDYSGAAPTAADVAGVLGRVKSPFYAVDLAEKEGGGWIVVEVNDGGTAGVPEGGDVAAFYRRLWGRFGAA